MSALVVQKDGGEAGPGPQVVFHAVVTAGNSMIVAIAQSSGPAGFTVADDVNGAYTLIESNAGIVQIFRFKSTAGADINVTVTCDPTTLYDVETYEVSGINNGSTPLIDDGNDGPTMNHTSCATGVTGTGFAVCANSYGSLTTTTPGGGWTLDSAGTASCIQQKVATFSADRGVFTTGGNVNNNGCMALFPDTGGASFNLVRP